MNELGEWFNTGLLVLGVIVAGAGMVWYKVMRLHHLLGGVPKPNKSGIVTLIGFAIIAVALVLITLHGREARAQGKLPMLPVSTAARE